MHLKIRELTLACLMTGCFVTQSHAADLAGSQPSEGSRAIVVHVAPEEEICQMWFNEAQVSEEAVNFFQKQQYRLADNLFEPLAKQGNLRAAVFLWDMYKTGKGVEENHGKADQWLRKAIDKDVHRAFFWMSEKDLQQHEGTSDRIQEACNTRVKAEKRDGPALQAIVNLLARYDRSSARGYPAIIDWYRKAANQNDPVAQYRLGDYLATGPKAIRNYAEGVSWLWKAYDNGQKEAINRLLKAYRDEVGSKDTPSTDFFLKGNVEFAQRIWAVPSARDLFLAFALEGKDTALLGFFLSNGVNPDSKTVDGASLLMAAISQNDREAVRVLLEHKADPNTLDARGNCPLLMVAASRTSDLEIARLLLDSGAKPNGVTPEGMRVTLKNPLSAAAGYFRRGSLRTDMLELLIQKGADVNFQGGDGHTLLMWAANAGYYEVVEFLMKHGADPTIKNGIGATAIYYAEASSNPDPRINKLLKSPPQTGSK